MNPHENNERAAARDEVINAHLYLVDRIVAPLSLNRRALGSLEGEDLRQEGRIGLVRAADTFDESKGAAFSTWATHCIESAVKDALRAAGGHVDEADLQNAAVQLQNVVEPSITDATQASDAKLIVEQFLPQLETAHPDAGEAIRLHFLQGFTKAAIAKEMKFSAVHVGRLIDLGLKWLRSAASSPLAA